MKKLLISGVAAAVLLATSAIPALAANSNASCMGFEASEISPPGSSGEEIGGMPQFNQEIKVFAESLGVPAGAIYGFIAKLHEGSHEACDAALE